MTVMMREPITPSQVIILKGLALGQEMPGSKRDYEHLEREVFAVRGWNGQFFITRLGEKVLSEFLDDYAEQKPIKRFEIWLVAAVVIVIFLLVLRIQ